MTYDTTMPTDFSDGQNVTELHLDPMARNIDWLRNKYQLIACKPADETVNNSATFQDDDHLQLSMELGTTYLLEFEGVYFSGVTPGFKTQFVVPAGVSGPTWGIGPNSFSGTSVTSLLNWGGTGADQRSKVKGRIVTTTTSGLLKLQWAQFTANASNTIIRAGAMLRLTVISQP